MWETKQYFETQKNTRENGIFHEDNLPALTACQAYQNRALSINFIL